MLFLKKDVQNAVIVVVHVAAKKFPHPKFGIPISFTYLCKTINEKTMPKKLIRDKTTKHIADWEQESIKNKFELNSLYALKVKEELQEIEDGNWQDVTEFADLIQVAYDYALSNGFTYEEIDRALLDKLIEKGFQYQEFYMEIK